MAYEIEDPELEQRKKRRQDYMNEFLGSDLPAWAQRRGGFQLSQVAGQSPQKRRTWLARGNVRERSRSRKAMLLDQANNQEQQRMMAGRQRQAMMQKMAMRNVPLSDREKFETQRGDAQRSDALRVAMQQAQFGQQERMQGGSQRFTAGQDLQGFRQGLFRDQITNQQRTGAAALANLQGMDAAALLRQQKLGDIDSQRDYDRTRFDYEQEHKTFAPQHEVFQDPSGQQEYLEKGGSIREGLKRVSPSRVEVNIGPTERPSPAERTEIRDARASLDNLDNIKALVDSSFVGPIQGRVGPISGLFGLTSQSQEEFYSASAAFANMIIKQITGAQMSETETVRIKAQIPKPEDPYHRWLANWNQSRNNVVMLLQRQQEVLRQSGMIVPGETPVPWDAQQPEELGSMSTEQILQRLRQMQ